MNLLKCFIVAVFFLCTLGGIPPSAKAGDASILPFAAGEKIVYTIKKFGLKAGEATLIFNGMTRMDGRDVYSITFTAKGFNFLDVEEIRADPKTFFPLRVERDINIFGRKEKITEHYEPRMGRVRIIKTAKGRVTEQVISKSEPLDNIYCFIYRYRRDGLFKIGDTSDIHLPTRDITVRLVKKKKLKAAAQIFDAFFMKSKPRKYKIWFDHGPGKIPLRIDGAVGFGKTAMVMKEYHQTALGAGE